MNKRRLLIANYTSIIPATDVTPVGVNLIPKLYSMSSTSGIVTGTSPTNSTYHVTANSTAQNELSRNAYRIFDSTNSGIVFENHVYEGSDITYTLHESQYNNGFFDPGTYRFFTSYYNRKVSSNCYMEFRFFIKDRNNIWQYITTYGPNYPNTPSTAIVEFSTDHKFSGIRMYKINSKNYDHTRNYQRYNTNLIRLSK